MKRYKLYMLQWPEDGTDVTTGEVARYPIGLPVRLIEERDDTVVVLEPHGDLVSFPKDAVGPGTDLEAEWEFYRHPERHRIYVDRLRSKLVTSCVDWEGLWDLDTAIEAFKSFKELYWCYHEEHGKDVANALFTIALHILVASQEPPEDHQHLVDLAFCALQGADYMLTVRYFVEGPDWEQVLAK